MNKIMPKIGYAAFQSAVKSSYSPDEYSIYFSGINFFAIDILLCGVTCGIWFYLNEHQ